MLEAISKLSYLHNYYYHLKILDGETQNVVCKRFEINNLHFAKTFEFVGFDKLFYFKII